MDEQKMEVRRVLQLHSYLTVQRTEPIHLTNHHFPKTQILVPDPEIYVLHG